MRNDNTPLSRFDRLRRSRARWDVVVVRIGSLMLSVARVTRDIEAGTFLNFVRFVRGKFMAGSRCCRVLPGRITESTEKERALRRERNGNPVCFFSRGKRKKSTKAEITSGYVSYVLLSLDTLSDCY